MMLPEGVFRRWKIEHSFLFHSFSEVWRDDTPLTAEDILELDIYCRERYIELVPSLASFGHLYKVLRTKQYTALCELPEGTICLNWGYSPTQSAEDTKNFQKAGALQYVCPGVQGWNSLVNDNKGAYENISRMCRYAKEYDAVGVLNTDWGDYGHINHPEFSVPGMIYGAAFSWNGQIRERNSG